MDAGDQKVIIIVKKNRASGLAFEPKRALGYREAEGRGGSQLEHCCGGQNIHDL